MRYHQSHYRLVNSVRAKRVETDDPTLVVYHREDEGADFYYEAKNREAYSLTEVKVLYKFHLTYHEPIPTVCFLDNYGLKYKLMPMDEAREK